MNNLKTLICILFPCLLVSFLQAQNDIHFTTSNHDSWTITNLQGQEVDLFDVSPCVNEEDLIVTLCGPSYPKAQGASCDHLPADAIWGESNLANRGCGFAVGTYFFTTTFNIESDPLSYHIDWQIVADNFFVIRLNGTPIGARSVLGFHSFSITDWQTRYNLTDCGVDWHFYNEPQRQGTEVLIDTNYQPIHIPALLRKGANTLEVEVTNVSSGVCANYAYLSFCGSIYQAPKGEEFPEVELIAFPNPSAGDITLDLGEYLCGVEVTVFNLLGQRVSTHRRNGASEVKLSLTMAKGIYMVRVEAEGRKRTSLKVVLK